MSRRFPFLSPQLCNKRLLHSEVLNNFPDWEVLPAMPSWERRGLSHHSQGEKFVRARGEEDWCNGFFVALLGKVLDHKKHERKGERKENTESDFSAEQVGSSKKKKKKSKEKDYECSDMEPAESCDLNEVDSAVKKKKKKKKAKSEESDEYSLASHSEETKKKKKKKSKD